MSIVRPTTFILWGKKFEEAPTTTFVTELRQAGLKVKIVGLDGRQTSGANGLALVPDMTLSRALMLVQQASCVILPCDAPRLRWCVTDPRVRRFLADARAGNALFVVSQAWAEATEATIASFLNATSFMVYPGCNDLVAFARELADSLNAIRN